MVGDQHRVDRASRLGTPGDSLQPTRSSDVSQQQSLTYRCGSCCGGRHSHRRLVAGICHRDAIRTLAFRNRFPHSRRSTIAPGLFRPRNPEIRTARSRHREGSANSCVAPSPAGLRSEQSLTLSTRSRHIAEWPVGSCAAACVLVLSLSSLCIWIVASEAIHQGVKQLRDQRSRGCRDGKFGGGEGEKLV